MDLKIDAAGDLEIVNGELAYVDNAPAIAQHIVMRLRTFLGESPYDRGAGVPYREIILQPTTPKFAREQILSNVVLETPGVTAVELEVNLDSTTHTLWVRGVAHGLNQPIPFAIEI